VCTASENEWKREREREREIIPLWPHTHTHTHILTHILTHTHTHTHNIKNVLLDHARLFKMYWYHIYKYTHTCIYEANRGCQCEYYCADHVCQYLHVCIERQGARERTQETDYPAASAVKRIEDEDMYVIVWNMYARMCMCAWREGARTCEWVCVCERERAREEEGTIIPLWPIFPFPSKMVVCIIVCACCMYAYGGIRVYVYMTQTHRRPHQCS